MGDNLDAIEKVCITPTNNGPQLQAESGCKTSVEVICEKIPTRDKTILKVVPLPDNKITKARETYVYGNPNIHGPAYGQTPYYQTQNVAGQPVYVQGAPPPMNASRQPTYRRRDSEEFTRNVFIFDDSFNIQEIRNNFVQRVYTILTVQLLYTCAFIGLCVFVEDVTYFVIRNLYLFYIAAILQMILYMALVCCVSVRRDFPTNFIVLALFTISFAYIMGVISIMHNTSIVMMAMGITAGICTLISLLACFAPCDITTCGMYLCLMSLVVMIFGIIAMIVTIVTGSSVTFMIYAGLIALLFSLYLMYDTQMIMGGHRIELSPEEYIFGALTLYVDIMQIFWAILMLLGLRR